MKNWKKIVRLLLMIVLSSTASICFAQPTDTLPPDPGSISVFTVQDLSFGAFTQGTSGGTVIISNEGVRSVTGTVVALNFGVSYYQSIFDIDAPEGTIISIMNGPDVELTGSNGGTMNLELGPSSPASPFATVVQQPLRTQVSIGGTLTVGNSTAAPPGVYTGEFYVTFNQE